MPAAYATATADLIGQMLGDEAARLRLEQADATRLQPYSWEAAAKRQEAAYRRLLQMAAGSCG